MKTIITIEIDHENDAAEHELKAIHDRHKNKKFVDELYDEVFRPVIKYDDNQRKVKQYQQIWEMIALYMSEVFDDY